MRQRTIVLVAVALAALTVFASVATAAATGLAGVGADAPAPAATGGAATDSVSPGQRLTGVIGAQRAEVEGEIASRSFDVRVSAASSSRAKASVVAEEVTDLEGRLETLQNRRSELERAHQNGNVSEGVYRARLTELAARIETTKRLVDATDTVANDLPENDLEAAGVRPTNIAQLRQRAVTLSERETVDLARSVVGDDVGEGMGAPASDPVDPNESTARGGGAVDGPGGDASAAETGTPDRDRSDGDTLGVDTSANASDDGTGTGGANASAETAADGAETGTPTNETTANGTVLGETTVETAASTTGTTTAETTESEFRSDWTSDETATSTDRTTTAAGTTTQTGTTSTETTTDAPTTTDTQTSTDAPTTTDTTAVSETRTVA